MTGDRAASVTCPLCGSGRVASLPETEGRRYFDCAVCGLVHLSPEQRPDRGTERGRYESHQNRPDDPRYRAFLNRLAAPLVDRLPTGAAGLDYGSGPGPTLSVMLEEQGFPTSIYDPFFAPDPAVFDATYDFITCTETAEHFHHPGQEFERLDRMLRPGGLLAVMTRLLDETIDFPTWWYARDPTHVCFYRLQTMEWIASTYRYRLELPVPNVIIFRKERSGRPT